MEKKGVKLICSSCGYFWTYKGKMTIKAACPNCRKIVNIKR